VHEESAVLAGRVFERLVERGANIVLPLVGASRSTIQRRIDFLRSQGYRVALAHLTVEQNEAYRRMAQRFLATGRLIKQDYYSAVGGRTRKTYYNLKRERKVDEAMDIDGNGPPGTYQLLD
jgi:predicted ABC-type ATPase